MAGNKNENQQSQEMMDKTYVVEGFDPSKLQNADVNLSQYWDDSSEANYNNPSLWGGENTKYTGENTLGSQVEYNPNATVEGLDPNYLYWQEAQMQNSKEANYIAKRNDEIASALYNAWKTSIQDVNDFLDSQRGFYNSVWNERANTVTAVWKRIGQIAKQNEKSDTPQAEWNKTPEQWNNDALNNMEGDLNKSTGGEIYWKVTADQDTHIKTLEDENSVYKTMNESRINAFKQLQGMSDDSIASLLISGLTASDSQAMRDLMQYDPAKYESVKLAEKKLRGQMNINTITSGEWDYVTSATNGKSGINNGIADFANSNGTSLTSTAEILKGINQTLSSNVSASSASETMDAIENDMYTLQNRLKNLKKEANQVFKGDVPQYIVNAYVANRTAEIQDQLSILENRYNAASSRYQEEVKNTQWQMEYDLKKEELKLKQQAAALEEYATKEWLAIDWYKALWTSSSTTTTTITGSSVQTSSLSQEEINDAVDNLVLACQNWQLGNAQCAAGIQTYYLPTLWVSLWTLSKWSEKQAICNEDASYTPKKWDLVVMSSASKPENWHMGIVVWFRGDKMVYMDWNGELWADGQWTEKAALREISLSNSKIYGYYNPTKTDTTAAYDPAYWEIYGKYLSGKFAAGKQLQTQASAMWKTVQQLDAEARAWRLDQNNSQDVTNRLDAIARLLNTWGENRAWRIVSSSGLAQTLFGSYADYDAAYKFVRDNITFDKLIELKRSGATFWALSDQELKAIGNAAQNLSKDMSNEEFQKQLTWIYNELLRGIWEEAMTTQEIKDAFVTKNYTPSSRVKNTTTTTTTTKKNKPTTTPTNSLPTQPISQTSPTETVDDRMQI